MATDPGALAGGREVDGGGALAGAGLLAGGWLPWHAPKTTNPTTKGRGVGSERRRSALMRSRFESVSRLPHRQNVPRLRRVILQLPAKLRDVDVDRTRHHFDAVTPHFAQQLDAGRHGAASTNECQQQIELLRTQCNRSALLRDGPRRWIDLHCPEMLVSVSI